MKTRIPGEQRQVLDFIIRMSYGYHRKQAEISAGKISDSLKMKRQHVYRAVKSLIEKQIITVTKKDYSGNVTYSIQKNYKKWKCNQKRLHEPKMVQSVTKKGSTPIKDNKDNSVVFRIIDYLNLMTGKNYKHTTMENIRSIRGRLNDGYTEEDIKSVIDIKTKEWINNEKMNKYLRPTTLFNQSKFEVYINQNVKPENESQEYIRAPKDFLT